MKIIGWNAGKHPRPSDKDIRDALEHARESTGEDGLSLKDFELRWLGNLSVAQLRSYDDIDAWLDLGPDSTDEDFRSFRGRAWADRAQRWMLEGPMPPIVIVSSYAQKGLFDRGSRSGLFTQIGDGRGRVNIASMYKLRLPTWELRQVRR